MSDLMQEVEDSFREEKIVNFWNKHGSMIIAIFVGTVLLTAAISGYKAWDKSARQAGTNQLLTLMESSDFPQNLQSSELNIRPNLKALGYLNGANAYLRQDNQVEALALYEKIISEGSVTNEIRELAILMATRIELANGDLPVSDIIDSYKSVADNEESPWRHQAKVELASVYAGKANNYVEAITLLEDVMETQGLPQTLYARANDLKHLYSLKNQENQKNGS